MADHIENSGLFSTGDVAALNNDLDLITIEACLP